MIESPVLERVLSEALRHGGDFAEVFAEDQSTSSAMLDDGRVEELSSGRERGAGIRVVAGRDHRVRPHRRSERGRACSGRPRRPRRWPGVGSVARPAVAVGSLGRTGPGRGEDRLAGLVAGSKADTLELLRRADEAARASGDAISQVQAGCGASRRRVLIANSDGLLAGDEQARSRFSVSCVATADTGLQTGFESAARTLGFEMFDEVSVDELAELAATRALSKLTARPAPSGELPVVLAGGQRRHPLPRGLRSRARGRPHREGRVGLHGHGRPAGGQPAGDPGRRRHGRDRSGGRSPSTTRAGRPSGTCSSTTGC